MRSLSARDHADEVRTILDAAPFPLVISRFADGTVLYANERLAALLELSVDELIGSATPSFYADPADRKALLSELERTGVVRDREILMRDPAGRDRWAILSVAVTKLRGEKVLVTGLSEITERKEAERALVASEHKFRSLVENANDLIYMLTPRGDIQLRVAELARRSRPRGLGDRRALVRAARPSR